MKEVKFLWKYLKRYGFQYLIGMICLFVVDQLNVYIPQYTGEITDGLKNHTIGMDGVWKLVGAILIMALLIAAGRFGWRFFINRPARMVERDIRNDMYAHLETLSSSYFNRNKTGDLMAFFTNDLAAVRMLMGPAVIATFDATVMLVLVLVRMVIYVDWRLTLLAILPLGMLSFLVLIYGKVMDKKFFIKQEAFSRLSDQVQESISGIRVIKAFVQERAEMEAFRKISAENKEKNLGVIRVMALAFPVLELIVGLSCLLTLLYGGYLCIYGEISLGQFIAFNEYINLLVWPMIAVGESITHFSQGIASTRRILTIFSEEPDIVDSDSCDSSIQTIEGAVELKHLTFAYPDQPTVPVLSDISLSLKAGETLAVIGRTGCGKSTIASLLLRIYNSEAGMITIDGHPLEDIPLQVLRGSIAYVPQDNFLFSDTLENNIAFGVEHATHEEVVEAAKAACIHDNIVEFPEQYETLVGERGVTLSGGQKQRSSIARALLKDAPILILDDSLSAVDTDTEEQILKNMKQLRAGKTTILVAHRVSTIQNADHILVLEDGRMAEYGSHDELMEKNGIYRRIYEKQQLERQLREEA